MTFVIELAGPQHFSVGLCMDESVDGSTLVYRRVSDKLIY